MTTQAPFDEKRFPFAMIALLLTLGGYAVGIGYNLAQINEDTRRVQVLEVKADTAMTKDDASDLKKRLERIEDKVDRITIRNAKMDAR